MRRFSKSSAMMLVVLVAAVPFGQGQLIANVKSFLEGLPTFGSDKGPTFSTDGQKVQVNVPTPSNVQFGTVDPKTGTWEYTDKSLGAGVAVGPTGATLLSRSAAAPGVDDFQQAARIGPDGLVIGPNKVSSDVNRAADQAQGTLGINNLKVGPDGITVNDGNRLNSTVQVNDKGIQLAGNPTGGGEAHIFIKPNLRVGNEQIAGAAGPAQQPSNVQVSVGDGKTTATEQLQGYTNYQLNPDTGTYSKTPNNAPPFMGIDPNGKPYTSFARAPAPGPSTPLLSTSQAVAANQQQGLLPADSAMSAGVAPTFASLAMSQGASAPNYQVVQNQPLPRQYTYGGDLVRGTPQSSAAYQSQVASRMPAGSNPYATANQDAAAIAQSAYVAQLAAPVLAPHPDIMSWDMPVTNSMAGSVPSALALAVPNLAPVSSVQPEAEDRAFAPGADIFSFKKKKKPHHSSTPPQSSHAPPKHSKAPSSKPPTSSGAAAGDTVSAKAATANPQPQQQPAPAVAGGTVTKTGGAATTAAQAQPAGAAVDNASPQDDAALSARIKELLGGGAEVVGQTSLQQQPSASAPATAGQDNGAAANSAVQGATNAVAQMQAAASNLGRRLLSA